MKAIVIESITYIPKYTFKKMVTAGTLVVSIMIVALQSESLF